MPVKGVVESWMGERRRDRKRESCNLYIKASIERVSSILAKREEDIQTRESIYIYVFALPVYGVSRNNSYEVFSKSGLMCSYRVSCPAKFTNARSLLSPPSWIKSKKTTRNI